MIRKCPKCNRYTLKDKCPKDGSKTEEVQYKFKKIRDALK
ncbi:MAG: nucleolar RNA-binding Nop10p family protein [Candidatus Pacearchaeota archaeon]